MNALRWISLALICLSMASCGSSNDTPPEQPSITGSNLFYGTTATFSVGVTTLNPGVVLEASNCTKLTPSTSTGVSKVFSCKITGTGPLTFTAKDELGKVLATKSFTVPDPQVQLVTSQGTVLFELYPSKAPISVDNFLKYVTSGFYDGTIFHRVIPNFVVQAGGFTSGTVQKTPTYPAIALESNNGLSNLAGTLAMARTAEPNTATSQFYINLVNNSNLDFVNEQRPGYAVFGKVLTGTDIIEAIGSTRTTTNNGMPDVPVNEISITSAKRIK